MQTALPNGSLYNYDIKQNVVVKDDGTGLTCYGNIHCKAAFQYNSSNCSGNYTPGGLSCDGNYNACVARPCSDRGYSSTRNNNVCTNVTYGGRTCYSCRAYTCAEKCGGYSTGTTCFKGQTKETCSGCGEYARCTGNACPSGVGSCANGCSPEVGKILYSDNSCNLDVISAKTPIGIIADANGSSGFAMALKYGESFFGCYGRDIPCLSNNSTGSLALIQDIHGSTNTSCLKYQCSDSGAKFPTGAIYCSNYSPVSSGKGSSGWYLPSISELKKISNNYSTIKASIIKAGGYSWDYFNLSSSEKNTTHYWGIMLDSGGVYEDRKDVIT